MRRPPKWKGEWTLTSPPVVSRDVVIVELAIADNGRTDMPSGEVRGFDARTGRAALDLPSGAHRLGRGGAQRLAAPGRRRRCAPHRGGERVERLIAADPARGLVFVPTSSPSPDYYGGARLGENRHANAVVALRATTGAVAWSFQTVHHDVWDYDNASPPLLYPGQRGPSVAFGSKPATCSCSIGLPARRISRSRSAASRRATSQESGPRRRGPFPSKPASLVPQRITAADIWGVTPAERESCLARLKTLRYDGVFTPPSLGGSLQVPGNIGGLQWGGMAWDETTRLVIAPVNHFGAIVTTRSPAPPSRRAGGTRGGCAGHRAGRHPRRDVARVLPQRRGPAVPVAAVGRAGGGPRRHRRDSRGAASSATCGSWSA